MCIRDSLRACVRVVVTRQVGEPDPELIPPGESREIAGRFQDQLGAGGNDEVVPRIERTVQFEQGLSIACLLYTSDAADERSSVDLGGRRIIKKKKQKKNNRKRMNKHENKRHMYDEH